MQPRNRVVFAALCLIAVIIAVNSVVAQQSSNAAPQVNRRERLLLYVATPGTAGGGATNGHGILVFDAWMKYRFVKRIPFPASWELPAWKDANDDEIKGMEVSAETGLIYISSLTGLSAFNLVTEKLVWKVLDDGTCCDRPSQSPDGKIMYVPERSPKRNQDGWLVVDAVTGKLIKKVDTPQSRSSHNTIYSLDGSKVFMAGTGGAYVSVADTKTHTVVQTIGPFSSNVRPFTINGAGTLVFVNTNDVLGFEIGDVRTGKKIHRVEVPGFTWSPDRIMGEFTPSHGIAMSPDEKEIWVTDTVHGMLHVFDSSVMPPKYKMSVRMTRRGNPNEVFNADNRQRTGEMLDYPYWVTFGLDGKLVYSSTGDVFDAATKQLVASLTDEFGRPVRSEKIVEVLFRDGKPVRVSDQFGFGQVKASATN